jgi:NAD(P)-dependent dehydrogenase (short-subunit alcohol dehydrogenase family)
MSEPIDADLQGRVCLVTGASSGIGRQTALELARLGATVVLACRDRVRGEAARRQVIAAASHPRVELELVDLSSLASIRDFVRRFRESHETLHVLVNNAGTWSSRRRTSVDGIELTWATNVLGYSLTTELLLETLKRGAPARIVNVASELARDLDLDDIGFERRPYSGITAYAQSKQADRMLTWELARRLEGSGVTANALHPGGVNTGLFWKGGGVPGLLGAAYGALFGRGVRQGADTVVWLSASPEVEGRSGRFFVDRRERRCRFADVPAEERLARLCREMTGVRASLGTAEPASR